MKEQTVKELMVPLEEYATINEDATLFDAIMTLEKAQERVEKSQGEFPHRAVLVYDRENRIIGKLSQLDILRGLEPKYRYAADKSGRISATGFSKSFLKSMVGQFALWDKPLLDLCRKAANLRVKDCMYIPVEGEYVDADDSLDVAINQLVMGHHQSLLVLKNDRIVGILRLVDVFKHVCATARECNL